MALNDATRRARANGWAPAPLALLLFGITVAAVITRFWALGDRSIWLDEAWGWRATKLPFGQMLDWAAQSKDPPLYYMVLTRWVQAFGDSESALRAPSAIASTLTALLLAWAGYRAGGMLLAITASAALLLNASNIEFAQEARMYPLVGLLALASALALASMLDRPGPRRAAVYVAAALALVYTHYSGLVVVGLQALVIASYGIARLRGGGDARTLVLGAACLGAISAAYVPWLPNLARHAGAGAGYIAPPDASTARQALRAALGLDGTGAFWIPLSAALMALAARALVRHRANLPVVCVASLAAVPLALLLISIAWTPVFDLRQASPYTPAAAFLVGMALVEAYGLLRRSGELLRLVAIPAGSAAFALFVLTSARQAVNTYDAAPVEDWRGAAEQAARTGGPILVWRRYSSTPLGYYTPDDAVIREIPPSLLIGEPLQNAPAGPATLILSHETPAEAKQITAMLGRQYRLGARVGLRGLTLYSLQPR